MNPFQVASEIFQREVLRLDELKIAGEQLEKIGDLEAYAAGLEAKVADLSSQLGVDGLAQKAKELTGQIAELESEKGRLGVAVSDNRSIAEGWAKQAAAHAEAAKTWNGEADRIIAKAQTDADGIVSAAKAGGRTLAERERNSIIATITETAKKEADDYQAKRKAALYDLEGKVLQAQADLDGLTAKKVAVEKQHGDLKKKIAALRANLPEID